jgi:hypothetical protein
MNKPMHNHDPVDASTAGISRRQALLAAVGAGACCGTAAAAVTTAGSKAKLEKIDIYNHVMPPPYLELVKKNYQDAGMVKRISVVRVAMLEQWPEVQQVITLGNPPPDSLFGPEGSPAAARAA